MPSSCARILAALDLPPRLKYEADGGPSVARCLQVLSASINAAADRQTFLLAQLAFWLLDAVEADLPKGFPARIWGPIAAGMRSQAKKLPLGEAGLR